MGLSLAIIALKLTLALIVVPDYSLYRHQSGTKGLLREEIHL